MADGKWIRVEAIAVEDDRTQAKEHILDAYPLLKGQYSADDENTQVLYLKMLRLQYHHLQRNRW